MLYYRATNTNRDEIVINIRLYVPYRISIIIMPFEFVWKRFERSMKHVARCYCVNVWNTLVTICFRRDCSFETLFESRFEKLEKNDEKPFIEYSTFSIHFRDECSFVRFAYRWNKFTLLCAFEFNSKSRNTLIRMNFIRKIEIYFSARCRNANKACRKHWI